MMRILAADDDPLVLELIRVVLGSAGFRILTACDGVEACRLATTHLLDALILDQNMPGRSGLDVAKVVRSDRRCADLPILMCTADASRDTVEAAKSAGADAFLVKPFTSKSLLERVKHLVRRKGSVWVLET